MTLGHDGKHGVLRCAGPQRGTSAARESTHQQRNNDSNADVENEALSSLHRTRADDTCARDPTIQISIAYMRERWGSLCSRFEALCDAQAVRDGRKFSGF
jgi:hypothetical protein